MDVLTRACDGEKTLGQHTRKISRHYEGRAHACGFVSQRGSIVIRKCREQNYSFGKHDMSAIETQSRPRGLLSQWLGHGSSPAHTACPWSF
jgi:hypothetical protein